MSSHVQAGWIFTALCNIIIKNPVWSIFIISHKRSQVKLLIKKGKWKLCQIWMSTPYGEVLRERTQSFSICSVCFFFSSFFLLLLCHLFILFLCLFTFWRMEGLNLHSSGKFSTGLWLQGHNSGWQQCGHCNSRLCVFRKGRGNCQGKAFDFHRTQWSFHQMRRRDYFKCLFSEIFWFF